MKYFIRYEKTNQENKWRANNLYPFKDLELALQQFYTGLTFAVIANGDILYIGVSKCSKKDNFDKKIARKIAIGRAEACMQVENENRLITFKGSNIIMTQSSFALMGSPASLVFLPEMLLTMIESIEKSNSANII